MASVSDHSRAEKAIRGITRRSIRFGELIGPALHDDVASKAYLRYFGKGQPFLYLADQTAPASGADTVEHIAILPSGGIIHYVPIGNATVLGPKANANGLLISLDATNAEGAAYVPGGLLGAWLATVSAANGGHGLFIRARFKVTTAASIGQLAAGFRKAEAAQAALTGYADLACLYNTGVDTKTFCITGGGADSIVDTTQNWADGETHEFEAQMSGKGVVKFLVDGKEPVVNQAYTFTDALNVVPFFQYVNAAGANTPVSLTKLEVGTLEHVGVSLLK